MNRVIFFSGLPKAGKSVTVHALLKLALAQGRGKEIFLERVHPDQEGNWTIESPGGQDAARAIKNVLKAEGTFWSEGFVRRAKLSVNGLAKTFPVVLADMGGIPSQQNREILAAARAAGAAVEAVILYPEGTDPEVWKKFWQEEGIEEPLLLATRFGATDFREERERVARDAWESLFEAIATSGGGI